MSVRKKFQIPGTNRLTFCSFMLTFQQPKHLILLRIPQVDDCVIKCKYGICWQIPLYHKFNLTKTKLFYFI